MVRLLFALLIFTANMPNMAPAQTVDLSTARRLYFGIAEDECRAKRLSEMFEKAAPTSPLLKAYYGASAAAAPACITNPASKIASFNKGKKLLDEAVNLDQNNVEIRFLRFATQVKAPGFLGYSKNISQDKKAILDNLLQASKTINNSFIFTEITKFLLTGDVLTAQEKEKVRSVKH